MAPGTVAYVYDGDTFVGTFDVEPQPAGLVVEVHYKSASAHAVANGLAPEVVARVLLGELVRDDLGDRSKSGGSRRPAHAIPTPRSPFPVFSDRSRDPVRQPTAG